MKEQIEKLKTGPLAQALTLYSTELSSHLSWLEEYFTPLKEVTPAEFFQACEAEARQLEHRFHTLKGGAGFLGLTPIFDLASQGDSLFKKAKVNCDDKELLKQTVLEMLHSLRGLTDELLSFLAMH